MWYKNTHSHLRFSKLTSEPIDTSLQILCTNQLKSRYLHVLSHLNINMQVSAEMFIRTAYSNAIVKSSDIIQITYWNGSETEGQNINEILDYSIPEWLHAWPLLYK